MSISLSAMIRPYLACSSELWGRVIPCVTNTLKISPEQSIHLAVVPPMQCGTPRYPRAVSMIPAGVALPAETGCSIPASINFSSRFSSAELIVTSGILRVISGVFITTPEELRPALPVAESPGTALREQEAVSISAATVRRVIYMPWALNTLTVNIIIYPASCCCQSSSIVIVSNLRLFCSPISMLIFLLNSILTGTPG